MMRMGTPRSEHGQIVTGSYGWIGGEYYQRRHDASDGETLWFRADVASRDRLANTSYEAGGADHAPEVDEWIPCAEPS